MRLFSSILLFHFFAANLYSSSLIDPEQIYAVGLSYQGHIDESGEEANHESGPPVFRKFAPAWNPSTGNKLVEIPTEESIYKELEKFNNPRMIRKLQRRFDEGFPTMLDYEVELGLVLLEETRLEDLNSQNEINVAFFVANDLSLRSIQILGEGEEDKLDYWSASKGFEGFLPIGELYHPETALNLDSWPDFNIQTRVDGELRQSASTREIVYSPREILRFVMQSQGKSVLSSSTSIITGTPSGVAFKVSRWKKFLGDLFGLSRYTKLLIAANDAEKNPLFLKRGSEVTVLLKTPNHENGRTILID